MSGGITTVPLRGIRAMIAEKMTRSLREAAQLTHHASADMSLLMAQKSKLAETGIKVSVEDLLVEITVKTIVNHPDINGTVVDREVRLSKNIHLCVAMALPGNLLVAPAIFDAQDKSLELLRSSRQDLSTRAKTNKLTTSEMTGGTFSLSNLGLTRVHHFTPILNIPQIAILGIGCVEERVVKTGDEFTVRSFVGLSLTFDHRVIDGAPAAAFLTDICDSIEGTRIDDLSSFN